MGLRYALLFGLFLTGATANAAPDVKGMIQTDFADYRGETSDLADGFLVRRAQVTLKGAWRSGLGYGLSVQFEDPGSGDGLQLREAFIDARLNDRWRLRAGSFGPLSNLDDATGAGDSMFLERASPAEIARSLAGGDGRVGVAVDGYGEAWTASLGLTGPRIAAENSEGQMGVVGRGTARLGGARGLQGHVGLNATWLFIPPSHSPGDRSVRLADRPESRVDGQRLIDTGDIAVTESWNLGVELGLRDGPLLLQSEAFLYGIERDAADGRDALLSGWYIQISRALLGAPRAYDASTASFRTTAGGFGLEAALRYSLTNLDEPTAGLSGGRQQILTFGLNWSLEPGLRISLNLQRIDIARPPKTGSAPGEGDVSANAVTARIQFTF